MLRVFSNTCIKVILSSENQYSQPGFPEYGCSVNMTKSLVNFDVTIDGMKTPRLQGSKYFPFCGAMINVETLDVIKDSTRMEYTSMSSTYLSLS